MFFLQFGFLTCAVYLAITFLLEAITWIVTWKNGGLFIRFTPWFYTPLFAIV